MIENTPRSGKAQKSESGSPAERSGLADLDARLQRKQPSTERRWVVADFSNISGVSCPCGTARRAFADTDIFPGTIHVTEISLDARKHYHKRLTETYYILECEPGGQMELDDERIDVKPGLCVVIPPGVRHRAIGRMKVLIVVLPKFDPADEYFD